MNLDANVILEIAREALEVEVEAITNASSRLGVGFQTAVNIIASLPDSGRAVVMGMGKSGHVGRKICATLASTGTPAVFVHPAEAGHGDLGMVTRSDCVIALSQSGESDEILALLPFVRRNGIPIIAMTGSVTSQLALNADTVIDTFVEREACPLGLAPTASSTLMLALGDALAVSLMKIRGFTTEQFAQTHPSGTLGRQLFVTVGDLMKTGDAMPVIFETATIYSALKEMSRGGLGFINIIDKQKRLIGIFTDGDLRRALDNRVEVHSTRIEAVANREFASISPAKLAVEAVEVMERKKVSALPVVSSDGILLGAINFRLLLQARVV